jgi:hypothetical protein
MPAFLNEFGVRITTKMNAIKTLLLKNLQSVTVLLFVATSFAPAVYAGSYPAYSPTNTPDQVTNPVDIQKAWQQYEGTPYPPEEGYHQGAGGTEADKEATATLPGRQWPTPGPPITAKVTGPAAARLNYYSKALNLAETGGYLPTNSGYAALKALETQDEIKDATNPQSAMWAASSLGNMAATSAANSLGSMAENQLESAIMFIQSFLTNFTAEGGNQWQAIRTNLFIPMAVLLLLPGAVLAQVKAIIAQGSPILGEVSPFEGITRSIVAIFMIPATALIMNYGIDVSNAVQSAIAMGYFQTFGSNMYADAIAAQERAFPENSQSQDDNNIPESPNGAATQSQTKAAGAAASGGTDGGQGYQEIGKFEGQNLNPSVPDEQQTSSMAASRLMMNGSNSMLATTWNIMCAFQMAFLYYLWCMGPIVAALWVWPLERLRSALPSWIEGVVTLCFWSLFWNTTILLMACFKGIGDTGTVMMTALNALANICVLYAFDFSSLISQGAASQMVGAVGQALSKASSGGGPSAGAGGGGGGASASRGGGAGSTGMSTPMDRARGMGMNGGGMGGLGGGLTANSRGRGGGAGGGEVDGGALNSPAMSPSILPATTDLAANGMAGGAAIPGLLGGAGAAAASAGGGALNGAMVPPGTQPVGDFASTSPIGGGQSGSNGMPFGMGGPPGVAGDDGFDGLDHSGLARPFDSNPSVADQALAAFRTDGQPGASSFDGITQPFGNSFGTESAGLPGAGFSNSELNALAGEFGKPISADNLGGQFGLPQDVGNAIGNNQPVPGSNLASETSAALTGGQFGQSAFGQAGQFGNFDKEGLPPLSGIDLSHISPLAANDGAAIQPAAFNADFGSFNRGAFSDFNASIPQISPLNPSDLPNINLQPIVPPSVQFDAPMSNLSVDSQFPRDSVANVDRINPYTTAVQSGDAVIGQTSNDYAQQQAAQDAYARQAEAAYARDAAAYNELAVQQQQQQQLADNNYQTAQAAQMAQAIEAQQVAVNNAQVAYQDNLGQAQQSAVEHAAQQSQTQMVFIGETSKQVQQDVYVPASPPTQSQQDASVVAQRSQPQPQVPNITPVIAGGGLSSFFAKTHLGSTPAPSQISRVSSAPSPPQSQTVAKQSADMQTQLAALQRGGGRKLTKEEEDAILKNSGFLKDNNKNV